MAQDQKKRARPVPANSQRSKKRQKIEAPKAKENVTKEVTKRPVALDALPWNEVEMPEMFEDAEGFYGLEEVDDVEVVREGNTVKFVSNVPELQWPVLICKVSTAAPAYEDDGEEFEGFGDDQASDEDRDETKTETVSAKPVKEKKQKKQKEKKQKETKEKEKTKKVENNVNESQADEELATNVFKALEEDANREGADVSAWQELDLSSETLTSLSRMGFSKPTLIQSTAIPEILAGHDVIGKASTGSGKTLAFGIPMLEKWLETHGDEDGEEQPHYPTGLVLSPTRELAHQLTEHITRLCAGVSDSPYVVAVTGGLSVQKQQRQLAKADIIIGTPGRLWEVMSSSNELMRSMKKIKFLAVDEADRLLTEGHFKEVKDILNALDRQEDADEDVSYTPERQTLVFSATFHKGLQQKLAGKGKGGLIGKDESMEYLLKKLNFREEQPKFIDVNPISQMASGLKEGLVECAGTEKVSSSSPTDSIC
jgi:ATP-dependent RNA helicase DDX24/MAK5